MTLSRTIAQRGRLAFIDLCIPLAVIAALLPGGIFVSVGLLAYLIYSNRALDALAALPFLVLANPILFKTSGLENLRYVVLLMALAKLWPGWRISDKGVSWSLALMATLIAFNAVVVSALPTISLFKGGLLTLVLWVMLNTHRVDWEGFADRLDRAIPWFVLLSLPTYFVPAIGFARNGTGFQGIMNQPQAFGVTSALLACWLLYRVWNNRVALPRVWGAATIGALLISVIFSEARTALLGFTFAFLITWLIQMLMGGRSLGLKILMTLIIGGLGLYTIQSSERLNSFVFKSGRSNADDILGAASESRGFLVQRSLENFQHEPLLGIGFGVPSRLETAEVSYLPVVNIPISVALEKGVWFSATLEEQGVIGMGALLIFFTSLLVYAIRRKHFMGIALLGFLLASNLGEMTMFSMGGLGLLQWVLVVAAFRILSVHRR